MCRSLQVRAGFVFVPLGRLMLSISSLSDWIRPWESVKPSSDESTDLLLLVFPLSAPTSMRLPGTKPLLKNELCKKNKNKNKANIKQGCTKRPGLASPSEEKENCSPHATPQSYSWWISIGNAKLHQKAQLPTTIFPQNKLIELRPNTEAYRNSFYCRIIKEWNSLPTSVLGISLCRIAPPPPFLHVDDTLVRRT